MIMKKLLTKTDKIEIIALLPNMALLATFKYLGFTSLIWMAGTCIQLAFMAFLIANIKNFSMFGESAVKGWPAVMFVWSVIYKTLSLTLLIIMYLNLDTAFKLMHLVTRIVTLAFIATSLEKGVHKEALVAFLYDIYIFVGGLVIIPIQHIF